MSATCKTKLVPLKDKFSCPLSFSSLEHSSQNLLVLHSKISEIYSLAYNSVVHLFVACDSVEWEQTAEITGCTAVWRMWEPELELRHTSPANERHQDQGIYKT